MFFQNGSINRYPSYTSGGLYDTIWSTDNVIILRLNKRDSRDYKLTCSVNGKEHVVKFEVADDGYVLTIIMSKQAQSVEILSFKQKDSK